VAEQGDSREPEQGATGQVRSLYRRKPVIAWGATAAVVGIVIAVVVILVVSGSSEPANVGIKCSVSNSNGTVVLTIKGRVTKKEAEDGCDELAGKLSGGGSYWRIGLPPVPTSFPEIMCGLNAPAGDSGSAVVEFNTEGSSYEATAICGNLAHKGWTQFTQGGVMGPWQAAYSVEQEATEEAEAAEAEIAEEEQLEAEAVEDAIVHCEQQAEAVEKEEIASIQQAMKQRRSEAPNEESAFTIEEESWAEEEEVWSRTEGRDERCRETEGKVGVKAVEYR
jgi:hypothetical protein